MVREQRGPMAEPDGVCTQCYVEALAATWECRRRAVPDGRDGKKGQSQMEVSVVVCSGGGGVSRTPAFQGEKVPAFSI